MVAGAVLSQVDLDAYCRRIGMARSDVVNPDRATLAAIVLAHTRAIAYENLDKFTGRDGGLDLAAVRAKLIHGGRGGGCFEQNLLLDAVLTAVGYSTSYLSGRVLWNRGPDEPLPSRGHMLLRVDLPEGPCVVDVGFAALVTGVLELGSTAEQATPHELLRLVPVESAYVLEARLDEFWHSLYRFDLAETYFADFEVASWYNGHHPDSKFVNDLLLARADEGLRHTLHGSKAGGVRLGVHHIGGPTEHRMLESPTEVRTAFETKFHLDLAELTNLDTCLARLF